MVAVGQLGRRPTKSDARTVRLAPIVAGSPGALPAAPLARNWGRHYLANGDQGDLISFGTFNNMTYGDCTCASFGHLDQAVCQATGAKPTIATSTVLEAYDAISVWDRSAPTVNDDGATNLDALRWFKKQGLIVAYASINEANRTHVETCINVCHGVYAGFDLPLSAQKQKVWDVAPPGKRDPSYDRRSWGGHAAMAVGYDDIGVWIVTWGRLQFMTWSFWYTYTEECNVAIHRQLVADVGKLSPAGFLAGQILATLATVKD